MCMTTESATYLLASGNLFRPNSTKLARLQPWLPDKLHVVCNVTCQRAAKSGSQATHQMHHEHVPCSD